MVGGIGLGLGFEWCGIGFVWIAVPNLIALSGECLQGGLVKVDEQRIDFKIAKEEDGESNVLNLLSSLRLRLFS